MKPTKTFFALTITSLLLIISNSCNSYIPADDNNFLMMRPGDIQLKEDVINRQKYIKEPTYNFSLKRFFSGLFATKVEENQTKVFPVTK